MNQGKKQSVKTLLEKSPWLFFGWCFRFKLEILLSVYLLYKRSPKKLSELKEIHENLKEEMEFTEDGMKPQKANGTRWVAHKVSAIC